MKQPYVIKRLSETPPVKCPCGDAYRIMTGEDNDLVSIHRVNVHIDAQKHYHEKLTEYYIILAGSGKLELGDELVDVEPGDVVMIPPLTRHAARGEFEIINVVCPPFDGEDEHPTAAE